MSYETISFSFSLTPDSPIEEDVSTETVDPIQGYLDRFPYRSIEHDHARLFVHLDKCNILETIRLPSSQQRRCDNCHTENFGKVLDESKILLPFPAGAFHGRTDLVGHVSVSKYGNMWSSTTGPHVVGITPTRRYASYTPYMIRQDIVRSGLFDESQLRGANGEFSHLFSRHELEVNAKAFELVRPISCITCRTIPLYGLSPHWGVIYDRSNVDLPAKVAVLPQNWTVDDLHIVDKRIRTGFRIRSRASILRRRYRGVKTTYCLRGDCIRDSSLAINLPKLRLKYVPHGADLKRFIHPRVGRWRKFHRQRRSRPTFIRAVEITVPLAHHVKYWYFMRKRGKALTSVHHPYPDDYLYLYSK